MKGMILIIAITLLTNCATGTTFNETLANKKMSSVIDTLFHNSSIYDEFQYLDERALIIKVNEIEVSQQVNSHDIPEGKNTLLVYCVVPYINQVNGTIYVSSKVLLEVNLLKGHTYEIHPIAVVDSKSNKESCVVKLNDLTEI